MDFSRTASFRPVINLIPLVDAHYIHLSEAGFKYMEGESVICEGCGKIVNINDFGQADPGARHFHNVHCSFVLSQSIHLPVSLNQGNNLTLPTLGATLMSGDSAPAHRLCKNSGHVTAENPLKPISENIGQAAKNPLKKISENFGQAAKNPLKQISEHFEQAANNPLKQISENIGQAAENPLNQISENIGQAAENPLNLISENIGQAAAVAESPLCQKELLTNDASSTGGIANTGSAGVVQASGNVILTYDVEVKSRQQQSTLETFDDRDIIVPEFEINPSNNSNPEDIRRTCQKNPGHFAYFSLPKLRLEQLPSHTRDQDTLRFLQIFSQLVVRVVCLVGKKDSHKDGFLEKRVGSGSLSLMDDITECHHTHKHRLSRAVTYMSHLVRKPRWSLFILTSRHLAKSDVDAANTQVEFFYDETSKAGVKSVKAISVRHSNIIGDNSAALVCETSDAMFVQRISKARRDVLDIAARLPRRAQKSMTKKLFIISHAHGQEKVLSYGDSVAVTYALKVKNQSESQVMEPVKIRSSELGREPLENLRKALLYAMDTCNGSTGAPIITFSKHCSATRDETGENFKLDIWVHNGVDRVHALGCSVLKECTEEDLLRLTQPSQTVTSHSDSDSDSEEKAETPKYSSVLKVQTSPMHADFASFKKRLESCVDWQFPHIHKPDVISHAGFFYSGYSDCVKCFYCGLGLKSWKPGDDLHMEHEKNRPTCAYLKRLAGETFMTESMESDSVRSQFDALHLVQLENKLLTEQLLCKVCHLSPVKDLFLPCGELITCTKCSKLLTHCFSCGKQILATVTTYFI